MIIIADQNSDDGSPEIPEKYKKVKLLRNPSKEYDEAERQQLLIGAAKTIPGPKIILALDADEILAANATASQGWAEMLKAKPGTVLLFEKPDLYGSTKSCIRYDNPWPLGYVDDGASHKPQRIHSIRIPVPEMHRIYFVRGAHVIHYGMASLRTHRARMRMYSVIENLKRNSPAGGALFTVRAETGYVLAALSLHSQSGFRMGATWDRNASNPREGVFLA